MATVTAIGTWTSRSEAIAFMENYRSRRLFGRNRGAILVDPTVLRDDGTIDNEHVTVLA